MHRTWNLIPKTVTVQWTAERIRGCILIKSYWLAMFIISEAVDWDTFVMLFCATKCLVGDKHTWKWVVCCNKGWGYLCRYNRIVEWVFLYIYLAWTIHNYGGKSLCFTKLPNTLAFELHRLFSHWKTMKQRVHFNMDCSHKHLLTNTLMTLPNFVIKPVAITKAALHSSG